MDFTNILLILLRLIHIVAAVAWVGLGAAATFYIAPAAMAAGDSGWRFLKKLFGGTSFGAIFGSAAGVTMLAGILMYIFAGSASHFSQTGNIVLGIGALFGLAAGVHGGAMTGRATTALDEALKQHVPDDDSQPIPAGGLVVLRELGAKMASHSRISMILMIVALIGMASARYL
jgi:uncharacterized membrane protein